MLPQGCFLRNSSLPCHILQCDYFLSFPLRHQSKFFRPASVQSVSPLLDFVEPWRGDCQTEVVVGSMVQLETQQGEQMFGVVKYIGDVPGPGRWAGVEMEEEVRGGNNGWVQVY